MIRAIEEFSLGAWPSLQQIVHDGWVLRFANGYTRRANSVNPLYAGYEPAEARIDFCEQAYRSRGLPVVFKLTPASEPAGLDLLLEQRGYRQTARTSVQCLSLSAVQSGHDGQMRTWPRANDDWSQAYAEMNGVRPEDRPALRGILGGIACPCCCAWRESGGAPVSCGMAVVQDRFVGLFDIVTHPHHRGRGHAAALVQHLLQWGKEQGARTAYLQVMLENAPALKLYRKLAFVEAYQYWYRTKP